MNRKHIGNKNASGCDKYVHYRFYREDSRSIELDEKQIKRGTEGYLEM